MPRIYKKHEDKQVQMSGINLTSSMRSNLLSLQGTSKLMDLTQQRLSTGKKVNSAIDNPSNFYTASSLSNRAKDLDALLDSMGQAISTIKAATVSLESGAKFLEYASAVANQALEQGGAIEDPASVMQTFAMRNATPDYSDYTEVRTVEELQTALADENIDKIVIMNSLEFKGTADTFAAITITEGKTLAGYDDSVTLTFDNSVHLEAMGDDAQWLIAFGAGLIVENGVTIQNLNIVSDTNGISANGNIYLDNVNIKSECFGIMTGSADVVSLDGDYSIDSAVGIFCYGDVEIYGNADINAQTGITQNNYDRYASIDGNINITVEEKPMEIFSEPISVGVAIANGVIGGNINIVNTIDRAFNLETGEGSVALSTEGATITGEINVVSAGSGVLLGNTTITDTARINVVSKNDTFLIDNSSIQQGAEINIGYSEEGEMQEYVVTSDIVSATALSREEMETLLTPYATGNTQSSTDFTDGVKDAVGGESGETEDNTPTDPEKVLSLANQYNQIISQFNSLISDSSYKGVNLLAGDGLDVRFNENGSSGLNIKGVNASSTSLGISNRDFLSQTDIEDAILEIKKAVGQIRNYINMLGNNYSIVMSRQSFTENFINVLTEGADKLTLADMNEESANMLSLQTRQQLAVNALSLASQASQSVLKLF